MKHLLLFNFLQSSSKASSSDPMANGVLDFMNDLGLTGAAANILGGIAVLIIGYFIAKYFSGLSKRMVRKTGVDDKMKSSTKLSTFVGKIIYFILMIIVLMTALNIMGVGSEVLAPLNEMVQKFMSAIPNIVTAAIIIFAGYYLAKIISEFVEFAGDTINSWVPKLRLPEGMDLVKIIKTIVFIMIFIPVLIVGLDYLHFDTITKPATSMLEQFMGSIPMIIQAVAIMLIAAVGGRIIKNLLTELLSNLKVDSLSEKMGISMVMGDVSLSKMLGNLVFALILYLGIMQTLEVLNLSSLTTVLNDVLYVAGKIFMGLLIVILGNVVANFVVKLFAKGEKPSFSLIIMRGAIIAIFLAMGLNAMDIADSIVNLAFGLALGAIAVAFALSFGLGGKEAAGEEMKKFFNRFNDKN